MKFSDLAILNASKNKCINVYSTSMSIASLYIAGSDTVTNTLRWLLFKLATNPSYQEIAFEEIEEVINSWGEIRKEKCHFIQSLLDENMRMFPVSDSLPHVATENVVLGDYLIEKGTLVISSILAVSHDPENFPEPEIFKPDR